MAAFLGWEISWMTVYSNTSSSSSASVLPCGPFRKCAGWRRGRFFGEMRYRTSDFSGGPAIQFASNEDDNSGPVVALTTSLVSVNGFIRPITDGWKALPDADDYLLARPVWQVKNTAANTNLNLAMLYGMWEIDDQS
jgi:hypothetical protein